MLKHILLLMMLTLVNCTSKQVTFRTMGGELIAEVNVKDYDRIANEVSDAARGTLILDPKGAAWRILKQSCSEVPELNQLTIKYAFTPSINADETLNIGVVQQPINLINTDIYMTPPYRQDPICYTVQFVTESIWPQAGDDDTLLKREVLPAGLVNLIEHDQRRKYLSEILIKRRTNGDLCIDDIVWAQNETTTYDGAFVMREQHECTEIFVSNGKVLIAGKDSYIKIGYLRGFDWNAVIPEWLINMYDALQSHTILRLGEGIGAIRNDVLSKLVESIPENIEYRFELNLPKEIVVVWNNPDDTRSYITIDRLEFNSMREISQITPLKPDLKTFLTELICNKKKLSSLVGIQYVPLPSANSDRECWGGLCKLWSRK